MKLNTLQLENYRNYEQATLDCHPEVNILIGRRTHKERQIYLNQFIP